MFGKGPMGSTRDVPEWIVKVVDEVESRYGFCTSGIYFKKAISPFYRGGCYFAHQKILQFYFGEKKTTERLWVVLHELAHAWQWLECPDTLTKKKPGRRNNVNHNEAFFRFAADLFREYGVLEFAAKNEYKRGRKYMV